MSRAGGGCGTDVGRTECFIVLAEFIGIYCRVWPKY